MRVRVSTELPCTEDELWQLILQPRSLQFVAAPILTFVPERQGDLDGLWELGRDYALRLYFLKCIPLGRHRLRLVTLDATRRVLATQEGGLLAPVWNHRIALSASAPGFVSYTDDIEIHAGWLTPVVWAFAHGFYRHRQRRWRVLLEQTRKTPGDRAGADHGL